jgi:hypothetical protein
MTLRPRSCLPIPSVYFFTTSNRNVRKALFPQHKCRTVLCDLLTQCHTSTETLCFLFLTQFAEHPIIGQFEFDRVYLINSRNSLIHELYAYRRVKNWLAGQQVPSSFQNNAEKRTQTRSNYTEITKYALCKFPFVADLRVYVCVAKGNMKQPTDIYKVIKKSLCTWWLQYKKHAKIF